MCNNCINSDIQAEGLPDPEDVLNDLASDITTKGFVKFKDAVEAMKHYASCASSHLRAENKELRLQISALTQALETQNRDNQPYIEELVAQREEAKHLLLRSRQLLCPTYKLLRTDIKLFLDKSNATGGDKPEQ